MGDGEGAMSGSCVSMLLGILGQLWWVEGVSISLSILYGGMRVGFFRVFRLAWTL